MYIQTLAMGLVAGGAAFRYDTKHKAILNGNAIKLLLANVKGLTMFSVVLMPM